MGPDVSQTVQEVVDSWDLTDVTLAGEDTNSISAEADNRAILGKWQVASPRTQGWIGLQC